MPLRLYHLRCAAPGPNEVQKMHYKLQMYRGENSLQMKDFWSKVTFEWQNNVKILYLTYFILLVHNQCILVPLWMVKLLANITISALFLHDGHLFYCGQSDLALRRFLNGFYVIAEPKWKSNRWNKITDILLNVVWNARACSFIFMLLNTGANGLLASNTDVSSLT